jgi:glycine/D-amino acid oxidase-like deaminating enzyme/nitrite reductase/ring-hydroxylating ferredoxin subunit
MDSQSLWLATSPPSPTYPRGDDLPSGLHVDVVIVGGGITGITTALLLQRAGKKVAILEARRVAEGDSAKTTAHLTEAVDARYHRLAKDFGAEAAREVARSSRAAIEQIVALAAEHGVACDLKRVPGYLYSESESDLEMLHTEYEAAKSAGVDVDMTRDVPLPFRAVAAVRFPNQGELHVRKYLVPLAEAVVAGGGLVFESARVTDIHDGEPCKVTLEGGQTITAGDVVMAAHAPLNRVAIQTKIAHYRSYAIAFPAKVDVAHALYWDTSDPYHYTRTQTIDGQRWLIVGGEDHKTGQNHDTLGCYARLAAYASERFGEVKIGHQWSGQIIEPMDGLPFIGKNPGASHVRIATAYSGNGMTFGTLAAMLLSDQVLGRDNPWSELYGASRVKPIAGAKDFVRENLDVPMHLIGDRLKKAEASSLDEVGRGEGKIVRLGGEKLAVFRDAGGDVHAFSPVCPHLGCHVDFNTAEKTWDCPCHGSRFGSTDGAVINGPAKVALTSKKVPETT